MVTPRSTATWPSSGSSSPVIIRNNVVLPAPLGPTRPTFSPLWSAIDASMKRICRPFCLPMLSRRRLGAREIHVSVAGRRASYDVERAQSTAAQRLPLHPCFDRGVDGGVQVASEVDRARDRHVGGGAHVVLYGLGRHAR